MQDQEPEAGGGDAAGGVLVGVRGAGEGAVHGEDRVAEPPAVQGAAGRGGDGVRVRHCWPPRAPLRRSALPQRAVGGGAGGGAAVFAPVQLRHRPRHRRILPA